MNNGQKSIAAMLAVVAALVPAGSTSGQCEPSILGSVDTPGRARDVAVAAGVAYVADDFGGLQVIDVSSCEPCPADLDGSGDVDFDDLLIVLSEWGDYKDCPPFIAADIDQDCDVDFDDLLVVLSAWGPCPK